MQQTIIFNSDRYYIIYATALGEKICTPFQHVILQAINFQRTCDLIQQILIKYSTNKLVLNYIFYATAFAYKNIK